MQSLSYHDRGVWWEMLLLMHESPVRGKLMIGGKAPSDELIANVLHLEVESYRSTVTTLLERGVCDRDSRTGAIMNRRMVRDEIERSKNRKKVSDWRKAKKTNTESNREETNKVTRWKPPSSSSSSSSISSSPSGGGYNAREARSPHPTSLRLDDADLDAVKEDAIPDDLPSAKLGIFLMRRLSIPYGPGLGAKFADAADLLARDEHLRRGEAARIVLQCARDNPPFDGRWNFWLEDGRWREAAAMRNGGRQNGHHS